VPVGRPQVPCLQSVSLGTLSILPTGHSNISRKTGEKFGVRQASTLFTDEVAAVDELLEQLHTNPDVVFCFVSPDFDLEIQGPMLAAAFPTADVVGATTSGQIGNSGYEPTGMTAASLCGTESTIQFLVSPLSSLATDMGMLTSHISAHLSTIPRNKHAFGFLLCDGLSMMEERLIAALYAGAGEMPIVGGSAGDNLAFERTHVLHDGKFHKNSAVLSVVVSPVPFGTLTVTHHVPTAQRMVITRADPQKRLVHEINGRPAAEVYAEMVGKTVEELGPDVFSRNPVMLCANGSNYTRGIMQIQEGGIIRFACAIETGLVLRLAKPTRIMESLRQAFDANEAEVGVPDVILGFDCILRRLEFESLGISDEVGDFLAEHHVVGFSTYGEQLHGVHVNQTFVGIALRGER
jgi:hypothetical protein